MLIQEYISQGSDKSAWSSLFNGIHSDEESEKNPASDTYFREANTHALVMSLSPTSLASSRGLEHLIETSAR